MKRRNFLRYALLATIVLVFALMMVFSACDAPTDEKKVVITPSDMQTFVTNTFDYTQMFSVTIDGEPYAVSASEIDSSGADLATPGTYTISIAIVVDGKTHTSSATLTVVAPRDASVTAKTNDATVIMLENAEEYDYKLLFTATVAGQPYQLRDEDIDLSEVDMTAEGMYYVTAQITVDGNVFSDDAAIYLIAQSSYDIASALQYDYTNYTVELYAQGLNEEADADYTEYRKIVPGKYSYYQEGSMTSELVYELDEDGTVKQGYRHNLTTDEWSRTSETYSSVIRYLEASELDPAVFTFVPSTGWFSYVGDREDGLDVASYDLTGIGENLGEKHSLDVKVRDGKIYQVRLICDDGIFLHTYYDFGETAIDIPHIEPVVSIVTLNREVFEDPSEFDFATMFVITVDGSRYTLSADEKASMIDHSSVDLTTPNTYTVTLNFTAPDGLEQHTAQATLTVREYVPPTENMTFAEALAYAANNSTMTKYMNSNPSQPTATYMIDGNTVYMQNLSGIMSEYLFDMTDITEDDKTAPKYDVKDGVVTPSTAANNYNFLFLKLLCSVAEDFTDDGNGVYTYTGDKLLNFLQKFTGMTTLKANDSNSIVVTFQNNEIISVQLNYKLLATSSTISYHRYEFSNIGRTLLPYHIPA